jgi:hypothetical protein
MEDSEQDKKPKIKKGTMVLMVATALFFDVLGALINLIPGLGQVLAIFIAWAGQATFWLWFKMHGVSYGTKKRAVSVTAGFIIGMIPFLNIIPELTLQVILILGTLEVEDLVENTPGGGAIVGGLTKITPK